MTCFLLSPGKSEGGSADGAVPHMNRAQILQFSTAETTLTEHFAIGNRRSNRVIEELTQGSQHDFGQRFSAGHCRSASDRYLKR
jgi:hypothetical protein